MARRDMLKQAFPDTLADGLFQSQRVWPQIADFWPRLGAAAIDWLLILAVGEVIALPFTEFWSHFGPYGRFVGIGIVLVYFGFMNSWIGKGQTIGKRLMKMAVRGRDNRPISLGRSFVRIAILAAPLMLYGWELPILLVPQMSFLRGMLVYGLAGAIAFTMISNPGPRQGIHDLLCGTYVVDLKSVPVEEFPKTDRFHWYMSALVIGVATIVVAWWNSLPPPLETRAALQDVQGLQSALDADPRFFTARANVTALTVASLDVNVWYRGVLNDAEQRQLRLDLARMAMEHSERIYQFDYLSTTVRSAYDLGIAAGNTTSDEIHWISVWRRLLAQ